MSIFKYLSPSYYTKPKVKEPAAKELLEKTIHNMVVDKIEYIVKAAEHHCAAIAASEAIAELQAMQVSDVPWLVKSAGCFGYGTVRWVPGTETPASVLSTTIADLERRRIDHTVQASSFSNAKNARESAIKELLALEESNGYTHGVGTVGNDEASGGSQPKGIQPPPPVL